VDREEVSNAARERAKAGREGAAAGGAGGDARRHRGKIVERKKTGLWIWSGKERGPFCKMLTTSLNSGRREYIISLTSSTKIYYIA
jgi:hypothetical protein